MNTDCVFCTIANGSADKLIWSNDEIAAFRDLHPHAPIHVLIVPKRHIARLSELRDPQLGGKLLEAAVEVARQEGIGDRFRLVTNNGAGAGQVINHLHFHLKGDPDNNLPVGADD